MQTLRVAISSFLFVVVATAMTGKAAAADYDATKAKLEAAMKAESRPEADAARDKNRKPVETLEFFGLRDDMKVIELIPGGGWYTRLLAPTLAENGQLHVAYGTGRVTEALKDLEGFDKVKVLAEDAKMGRPEGARLYFANNTDIDAKNVDMVLTFRNYHNFNAESRAAINASVFKTLKRGGVYGLVDHTRRHMQELSAENRRRFDPVEAILEIQAAGFVFEGYSPLHYRLDDELVYEVGRRSVSGNTDRWTLKFTKP
ncbi:MAG: class I SAM-dependent methyltransferase [Pseudomonadales bacterium]